MPDRVHQVRLAQSHPAVDEQRVVGARRRLGDGAARRVGELVRRSDDEGVEGIAGSRGCRRAHRRLRFRGSVIAGESTGGASGDWIDDRVRRRSGRSVTNVTAVPLRSIFRAPHPAPPHSASSASHGTVRSAPAPAALPIVRHERRGLEPGVEDVTVDLRLDAGENLVPDAAAGHDRLSSLC